MLMHSLDMQFARLALSLQSTGMQRIIIWQFSSAACVLALFACHVSFVWFVHFLMSYPPHALHLQPLHFTLLDIAHVNNVARGLGYAG